MNYQQLHGQTRVWVYQSSRALSETEVESIKKMGEKFIQNWAAHGAKLNAAFEIFHNQFVVLFVDEEQAKASGCSIDSSVRFIKQLEQDFDISLLDRNQVAYIKENTLLTSSRQEFAKLAQEGTIGPDTIVFNNLVSTKADFDSKWRVPIRESWHAELISK